MKTKFKTGDWVRIKSGRLRGYVATVDKVLRLPSLDHALYVVKYPDEKNIELLSFPAQNQYISKQLEKTEIFANKWDSVYITDPSLYGCGAIVEKIQRKCIYGPKSDTPTDYKYMYTLRYVDPKTKETTTGEFEYRQFSHIKPKYLPIQMVEFRKQDSQKTNAYECKEPITFHCDESPGHAEIHDSGAISWVHDYPEPSKEMIDYNKKDTDNIIRVKYRIAWNEICFQYVEEFCKKHGYTLERYAWVDGDVGTTICINDMYIGMDEIRYDVDNDIPVEKFEDWYWKSLDIYELVGEKWLNYSSFCKGALDPWPEERLKKIRESKKKIDQLNQELYNEIENYKRQNKKEIGHF